MRSFVLGDLVDIKGGGTPNRGEPSFWNGEVPWATVKDFKSTELSKTEDSITHQGVANSATNIIPAGTIVVPTRMAVGKAAVTSVDMAINQDLKALIIRDNSQVDQRYLLRFLLGKAQMLEGMAKGATVKGITLDVLREIEVPLPPLAEQKRIAAILDKADAIRRKRQHAIQLADEFLRSVFLDMFGDPAINPKTWDKFPLGNLSVLGPDNGIFRKNEEYGEGLPVVWVEQLYRDDVLDVSRSRQLSPTAKELKKYGLNKGDIVFCRSSLKREGVGFNNIYDGDNERALFECHMTRVRLDHKRVNPFFANYLLRMKNMRLHVIAQSKTVTMTTMDQDGISRIEVILPPKSLQDKFEQILRSIVVHKRKSASLFWEANNAFLSTSQRAFLGDL
ncbi:MAG: restriction endonuclease subunit S [gamma proteobacterium symbiont of Ctena orbiculata]|nr:MAG: restriction endonuclease subunit S [gamma proteobacterium symbiont of Ctena orbiculata]